MSTAAFDVQEYMAKGVEQIVQDALRATLRNPKETAFLTRFALASARAARLRERQEREGLHVPAFLIASITSSCNLHCAGCYSRANHATVDCAPTEQLSDEEWRRIFREAEELGVSFILLAGGEPMLRRGVIAAAGEMPDVLFPVFTNGTFMDEGSRALFERCRNLIPVISLEGGREETDARRGAGIYDRMTANMDRFREQGLLYGVSLTVTAKNLRACVSDAFLDTLAARGCKLVFLVEYVPVTEDSRALAPGEAERAYLEERLAELRRDRPEMLFVSFPGDEKASGGCLAAGRGFFHINSHGGAEPCPFSPYSGSSVRDTSLREALNDPFFAALRDAHLLEGDHAGGCVLFAKQAQVESLLASLRAGG